MARMKIKNNDRLAGVDATEKYGILVDSPET